MKKTRQLVTIGLLATGLVALYGCSSDAMQEEDGGNNNGNIQPVELKIQTSVEMARAATEGVVTGDAFAEGDKIIVCASSDKYNIAGNNYAVYEKGSSTWAIASSTTDKIYLSTEDATVYAVYPSTLTVAHGNGDNIASTTDVSGLTLFEGTTTGADDNNKIELSASPQTGDIFAAKGEKDYLWATPVENKNATSPTASLKMNHALAMVSFKFYKESTFPGNGELTKIELEDVAGNSPVVFKTGSATMKLGTGAITVTGDGSKKLTRFTYNNGTANYTLGTNNTGLPAFSMLVYPITDLNADKVQATFTIDGVAYPVKLPAATGNSNSNVWAAGYNTVYTVQMKVKELVVSVSVEKWKDATINDGNLTPIQ
jgi:hypothetical protein